MLFTQMPSNCLPPWSVPCMLPGAQGLQHKRQAMSAGTGGKRKGGRRWMRELLSEEGQTKEGR